MTIKRDGGGSLPPPKRRPPHNRVTYDCIDCGDRCTRIREPDEPRVCVECGINRGMDAARQMAEKRGPYYDKWLASNGPGGRGANRGKA